MDIQGRIFIVVNIAVLRVKIGPFWFAVSLSFTVNEHVTVRFMFCGNGQ